jgi:hypothetical protein
VDIVDKHNQIGLERTGCYIWSDEVRNSLPYGTLGEC